MDETDRPQTPMELLVILAAIADEGVPIQTIAPKFTGRFNKGVDYAGSVEAFARDFYDDLSILAFAVERYGLPDNLKLSVHSGSDKFSIYPVMHDALVRSSAGLHVKTAGTTWLEELAGLAQAGSQALALVKAIYAEALARREELCAPYANVIAIDAARLPGANLVESWSAEQMVEALRHDGRRSGYNPDLRQLLHVAFKVAAQMGERYTDALAAHHAMVAAGVTENLFERHIRPIFLG